MFLLFSLWNTFFRFYTIFVSILSHLVGGQLTSKVYLLGFFVFSSFIFRYLRNKSVSDTRILYVVHAVICHVIIYTSGMYLSRRSRCYDGGHVFITPFTYLSRRARIYHVVSVFLSRRVHICCVVYVYVTSRTFKQRLWRSSVLTYDLWHVFMTSAGVYLERLLTRFYDVCRHVFMTSGRG